MDKEPGITSPPWNLPTETNRCLRGDLLNPEPQRSQERIGDCRAWCHGLEPAGDSPGSDVREAPRELAKRKCEPAGAREGGLGTPKGGGARLCEGGWQGLGRRVVLEVMSH